MIGALLSHYRITAKLGEGGMGEVYRATDTKLGREVAIKLLPATFSRDPRYLSRFEREAKALAALNHPHIAAIYGFEVDQGTHFLVLELVEGETLAERLRRGPLPVKQALTVARQIAEALQEAHEEGIVHRDLKPGNVKITPNGRVKVLDFGLAKIGQAMCGEPGQGVPPASDPEAATIPADTTLPGAVMGTPAYMSPEQARGQEVDKRTDVWAFGCCVYECLSGRKPFRGPTASELIAEVLKSEPDWSQLPTETPREVGTLLRRCLEKDSSRRLSSIGDIALTLEETTRMPDSSLVPPTSQVQSAPRPTASPTDTPSNWRWPVAAGLFILVIGAGVFFWKRSGSDRHLQSGFDVVRTNAVPLPSAASVSDQKSIAVLPFVNMSADKADEYLSDGMTEELLNVLAKIKGLRVPGRSSSFSFKGKTGQDIFRIVGEQLHVQSVLEGSVRKVGNQLRINAQLINVADGFQLWSDTYDRDMTNIFVTQSDIAARVAEALKVQLLGAMAPLKKPTENMEAYKLYLQGRQLWNRRTIESVQQAVVYFNQAIDKDQGYAQAYAGLADCYAVLPNYAGLPLREAVPKGRAAAQKALELDSSLAEPHATLAMFKATFDWDLPGAEAGFRQAIALNPNYATAHHWMAMGVFAPLRRFDEALAELQTAQELDPLSPIINNDVGEFLGLVGKPDLGIKILQKQIAIDPSFLVSRAILASVYYGAGKLPEAVTELETMHRLDGGGAYRLDYLGFIYARAGRTNEARAMLGQLQELQRRGLDYRVGIAQVQHGLGDDEGALASLELAFEEKAASLFTVNFRAWWKDLCPHPRAQAILKRMNLVK